MDLGNLNKKADLDTGEWVDDIPEMDGVRFRVRSTTFKPYKAAVAGLARRSGKKLRTDAGVVNFSIASGKPLADHILLEWNGVTENGKPVKYDPKKALAVLTADDDFGIGDTFRRGVEWAGDSIAERIKETVKETAGN